MHIYAVVSIIMVVLFIIEQNSHKRKPRNLRGTLGADGGPLRVNNAEERNRSQLNNGIKLGNKKHNNPLPIYHSGVGKFLFIFAAFLLVGLLAFRGIDVGGDTPHYCGYFTGRGGEYGTPETNEDFEWGFVFICDVLRLIGNNDFWFIFSTSVLAMLPWVYLVWRDCKRSKMLPFCFLMTLWGMYSVEVGAVRQVLSVSCMLMAYIIWTSNPKATNLALFKNDKIRYFKEVKLQLLVVSVFLLFGYYTHTSNFVVLPLIAAAVLIPFTKRTAIITMVGSLVLVLAMQSLFGEIFELFNRLMMGYDMANHMLDTYYGNAQYALDAEVSFNRLAPATLLVCVLIWMSNEEDMKSVYFRLLVVGASIYNIGAPFPMIFRTVFLLLFVGILFVPSGLGAKKNRMLRIVCVLLLLFFIRNQIVYWKPGTEDMMLPYSFIWE